MPFLTEPADELEYDSSSISHPGRIRSRARDEATRIAPSNEEKSATASGIAGGCGLTAEFHEKSESETARGSLRRLDT
jgi:hypothetical protein